MTAFKDYAEFYDLFYADKDYAAEAAFVRRIIRRHVLNAQSVLELGCGTARHAIELATDGFSITGVDISAQMLAGARKRLEQLPALLRDRIDLVQGDVSNFSPGRRYDAVISLFHVVSYQITDAALHGIFRSARKALGRGGLFLFDFWYGPAVLAQKPAVRRRTIETADRRITRIAEPVHDVHRNIVDVGLTFLINDLDGAGTQEIRERHPMRYLFLPEIESIATANGFTVVESGEWLTEERLDDRCWAGYVAARLLQD